jgi:autotransporter-associated beta strand protein
MTTSCHNATSQFLRLLLVLCCLRPGYAGTFSSSTTAPVVNGADIANLATQTGSDKWFFQTSDEANPADAAKGQTFITGSTPVRLKALTYKISSGNMKAAPTTYVVRLGTLSGTAFTQIVSDTVSQTASTASGAYMTWTFTNPVTLQPSTTYAIDVGMDSGVSYTTGIPYLSYTANITNARIGSYYDSGDLGAGNATVALTTARDRVFHLDLEDPQNPSPDDGATVPAGNVALSWRNLTPTTGSNVWVDVWFGQTATSLTKVVSQALNLTTHTVNAPTAGTYYWRIDSYLGGSATGTATPGTLFDFRVADTDGDGMPDAFELLHTTPASGTALLPSEDVDADGLTNLQEYQRGTLPRDNDTDNDTLLDGPELTGVGSRPPTVPTDADSDNDGLNDGVESNTGIWVSTTDRGTNPTRADTDNDGLSDGVESNTGAYTSEANTGTNPLRRDTDADNAEDWYEVAAAATNPNQATSKPNVPYPLPDPDSSTGTGTNPVKVFILSGQSNMVGFGRVSGSENDTLQSLTRTELKFPNLLTSTNAWTVRNDVLYRGVISALGDAPLAPGFGESSSSFGPELGFGHVVGYVHDEPVLIIKSSIGNRALGWDFLPPGSVPYTTGGTVYPGYGDYDDYPAGGTPPVTGPWYAGKQYDDSFLDEEDMGPKAWSSGIAYISGCYVKNAGRTYVSKSAHTSAAATAPGVGASWSTYWTLYSVFNTVDILDNFAAEYPQWATRGFEIAGIGWFQGWNDGQSGTTAWANRYEQNLVRLIKQLRSYYHARYPTQAKPNIPFVTVTCGFDGFTATGNRLTVVNAQNAISDAVKYPEFAGNVKSMEGRGYWRTSGPNTVQNYHYYHNAETYMLVGDAMGRGMVDLLTQPLSSYTWARNAPGPSLWQTPENWAPATGTPGGLDDLALLTNDITANQQISLNAPVTLGGLEIGDAAGDNAFTIEASTGFPMTFATSSGSSATLTRSATGTGTDTLAPAIVLAESLALSVTTATGSLSMTGPISQTGGARSITKNGAGTLILSGANSYSGGTILSNGSLFISHASALGSGLLTIGGTNNPLLRNDSGASLSLPNTPMNWVGNFRCSGSGLDFGTGNITISANGTQEIGSGTLTLGGVMSGAQGINKTGSGTLIFNGLNTYTGQTNLRQGVLAINTLRNYGVPSSLGAPTSGNIILASTNSTTLNYTGTGDITNRPIQVGGVATGAATATLANNGAGPLVFTATTFNVPVAMTGGAARVLLLGGNFGSAASPNEIQGIIADNTLNGASAPANQVSLTKSGNGAWKLSGGNTYTGNTNITAGSLILGANNVLPNTTNVTLGDATLDLATRTDTAGTLQVTAAATIRLSTGAAIAFADSSAVAWAGTLTLVGDFASGTSLRFGTSAASLTATQLSKITAPGFTSFSLNSSGFLVGGAEPTFSQWQTANGVTSAFNADHDNDGVPNGIEYFLGGSANTTGKTTLPSIASAAGAHSITWHKAAAYSGIYGTHFTVETTDALTGAWIPEPLAGNVTITGQQVRYTFPTGNARRFVRLRITGP